MGSKCCGQVGEVRVDGQRALDDNFHGDRDERLAVLLARPMVDPSSNPVSTNPALCGTLTTTGSATTTATNTAALGLRVDSGVHVGGTGVYVTSDRRIKQNIAPIRFRDALHFIMNVEPHTYQLKDEPITNQIGYIAQELRASRFGSMVSFGFEKEEFPAEAPDDVENVLLVAQYERICCILHKGLQDALQRIDKLETEVVKLIRKSVT
jgi:hypothetical protein